MRSVQQTLALTLGLVAVVVPTGAFAQTTGVQVWAQRCAMCHRQQPADRYTAERWESVMTHMALTARLTTVQADAVLEFLKSGAKQVAMQETAEPTEMTVAAAGGIFVPGPDGEQIFKEYCVPCHGKSGEGDGPAASAFDPGPSDLTDSAVIGNKTAEELVRAIAVGGGGMPAFAATLSAEEIEAVTEYILSF